MSVDLVSGFPGFPRIALTFRYTGALCSPGSPDRQTGRSVPRCLCFPATVQSGGVSGFSAWGLCCPNRSRGAILGPGLPLFLDFPEAGALL